MEPAPGPGVRRWLDLAWTDGFVCHPVVSGDPESSSRNPPASRQFAPESRRVPQTEEQRPGQIETANRKAKRQTSQPEIGFSWTNPSCTRDNAWLMFRKLDL